MFDAIIMGAPTYHHDMPMDMKKLFEEAAMKNINLKGKFGAAFGSYGWSGEAVGQVREILEAMKVELVHDGLRQRFVPDAKCLGECAALGRAAAEKLIARVG